MTKTDLIQHFGSVSAVAAALNIKQPSVSAWAEELPVLRQLEIEAMTAGLLRAGPECDRYRVPQVATPARAPDAPATGPGALDEQEAA